MSVNESMVSEIVKEVMAHLAMNETQEKPQYGIFSDMN